MIDPPVTVPAVSDEMNDVTTFARVAKKLDDVALVVDALVAKRFVAVALVITPFTPVMFVEYRLVEVLFVVDALVAVRLVVVADTAVSAESDVVASVVRPLVTVNVPFEVNDDVAVIDPPVTVPAVNDVMNDVTTFARVAKKLDDVALVFVRSLIVPVVEKSVATVPTVVDEVLSTV